MTNTTEILALIQERGIKKQHIAKTLDISVPTLWRKIRGTSDFKQTEIVELCDILGVRTSAERDRLFFCHKS
ncbi:MAG: helix-turn-helix domain-containing protein [Lachnospiraceae bacterium]|nr:helix-turn-helix domain-containing protein [Lachnospiraceae bacterium]